VAVSDLSAYLSFVLKGQSTMSKKRVKQKSCGYSRGVRTWVKTLTTEDIEQLRQRMAEKGPLWSEWEYKLHRGNIIICTPVTPWDPRTCKPDPQRRYMAKHLRIVPSLPGPYGLEYFRHTGRWQPLPCTGSIEEIADLIEADDFGLCAPTEPPASIQQNQ